MAQLTVEQLAQRTGMTVRNIRAYQARHLLHGPSMAGRQAVYDETHVERIGLIRRLVDEGFNLDAARILIEQGDSFTAEINRLRENLGLEEPGTVTWVPMSPAALRLAREHGPDTLNRLVAAELLRRDADGQVWVRQEFRIGWRLLDLGLPPSALYALLFAVDRAVSPLGRAYADEVQSCGLDRRVTGATPAQVRDDLAELTEAVAQLLAATFEVSVRRELARTLEARLRSSRRRGRS